MTTQRDDAAYKEAYYRWYADLRQAHRRGLELHIKSAGLHGYRGVSVTNAEHVSGRIDAATDILMERGLCSSVLSWHIRPARAADDLEW